MKFSCDKSLLSETIQNVSLAVASKSSIIALEGILMRCEDGSLTLTGYNLELGIVKTIPVQSEEDGEIVLSAGLFSNIVSKMPAGMVSLESNEKLLTVIRGGGVEFTILGLSTEDYPEIPSVSEDSGFALSQETFQSAVAQTLFAVAQNNQNPVYTGSLFSVEDSRLTVAAVDGYRLAIRTEPLSLSQEASFQFIVPGKTLSELLKLLAKLSGGEEQEAEIFLRVSNRHIIFEASGYSIISRLLEGDFLDFRSAIPAGAKTRLVVNTREFMECINRASIIINERAQSPIKCDVSDGVVHLSCESTLGRVQDSFPAAVEGDAVRIGFNNRFMYDALRASGCDQVVIEINEPTSPMKVLPMEGDSFLFLVLPIRL